MRLKYLRKVIKYDQNTGIFTWIKCNKKGLNGLTAGTIACGYVEICINQNRYRAHRLAWFYMKGEWPPYEIDHINGIKNDNRFCNLRLATRSQNVANRSKPKRGGLLKGTCRQRNGFGAKIGVNGEQIWLGTFQTEKQAHTAYKVAVKTYFGEFSPCE